MKLLLDCVDELPPDLQLEVRRSRAVTDNGAEMAASAVRRRHLVLRFLFGPSYQAP